MQKINNVWLADSQYVAGDDVSIADLLLSTEIDMLILLDASAKVGRRMFHLSVCERREYEKQSGIIRLRNNDSCNRDRISRSSWNPMKGSRPGWPVCGLGVRLNMKSHMQCWIERTSGTWMFLAAREANCSV